MFGLAASFDLTHTVEEQRLVVAAKREIRERDFPRPLIEGPEPDVPFSWRGLAIAVGTLVLIVSMLVLLALVVVHG